MKKTIGDKIRKAREKKELTREKLAKKLDISAGYLGHLENDSPVRLSPRVANLLKKILSAHISKADFEAHNKTSLKVYRNYRKNADKTA